MSFYAPNAAGVTRRMTPEGYMICEGVAIGRTGEQTYILADLKPSDPGDKQLTADDAGKVIVQRLPEEIFRDESMASFEGKPITVMHPNAFVNPSNWKQLSVGVVQHVRQGKDADSDLLIADLVIKDADAIEYVNRELPDLSAGYHSKYEQTAPGQAIQRHIIGNHVALLGKGIRGRAGSRCAVKDSNGDNDSMSSKFFDRFKSVMTAFQTNDEAALKAALADEHDDAALEKIEARLQSAEQWIADRKTQDAKTEGERIEALKAQEALATQDATYAPEEVTAVFSRAEILSPGIQVPTADALKAKGSLPNFMLSVVKKVFATSDGKAIVEPFLMGKSIDTLTTDSVQGVFIASAELMTHKNRLKAAPTVVVTDQSVPIDLNKNFEDFWNNNAKST